MAKTFSFRSKKHSKYYRLYDHVSTHQVSVICPVTEDGSLCVNNLYDLNKTWNFFHVIQASGRQKVFCFFFKHTLSRQSLKLGR